MNILPILRSVSTAGSAAIVALLPIVVALDFGGVLRWTQYVSATAIVVAFCLALPGLFPGGHTGRGRQFATVVALVIWLIYAWLHTWTLPPSIVNILSPGSYTAYTQWLTGIIDPAELPQEFPISLAVYDSRHALAMLAILIPLSWVASIAFCTRARMIGLLSVVAISGGVLAGLGILLQFVDELRIGGSLFGPFINRNNAALMLNLGLAASLGLLSWRLTALTGQEVDDSKFEFNDLFSLTSDRESAIGMISAVLCIVGLLVSGSRGGLGAALVGGLLAFGWVRRRRGFSTIPVVGVAIAVLAAILLVPLQLSLDSIKRFEFLSGSADTLLQDGRFSHWPDGWNTALAHLPMGSGLSTYAYAYLPHQSTSAPSWFHHADNLWLELFVEQGFFGIVLAVGVLVLFARAINGFTDTHDALDQGVQTMGWFSFGAILFSQTFDFGLIVPANLYLITIIVSAVVAHSGTFSGLSRRRRR